MRWFKDELQSLPKSMYFYFILTYIIVAFGDPNPKWSGLLGYPCSFSYSQPYTLAIVPLPLPGCWKHCLLCLLYIYPLTSHSWQTSPEKAAQTALENLLGSVTFLAWSWFFNSYLSFFFQISSNTHTSIYAHIHIHIYIRMCIYMYTLVYVHVYYMHVHTHMFFFFGIHSTSLVFLSGKVVLYYLPLM